MNDNLEQLNWMSFQVAMAGYNGIEDAILRSPKYFESLAIEWRTSIALSMIRGDHGLPNRY